MSKGKDLNDRAVDGTLPDDPAAGATPVSADVPRVLTVREIIHSAQQRAFAPRSKQTGCTSGNYEIDKITGGFKPGFVTVFGADTSWGKCLGKGTKVMRADGTSAAAEDVRAGDLLMGPDSKPREVLTTTSGVGPLYRIVPMRGESWVCNWAHILVVVSTRTGVVTEISVEDFLKKSPTWRHQQKLFHVGVDYHQGEAPTIDPWLLGLWYGDGSKGLMGVTFTTADTEVVTGIEIQAAAWGLHVRENRKVGNQAASYSIATKRAVGGEWGAFNPLLVELRKVVNRGPGLPENYVRGSRETRLGFLAGLIDSDGYKKDNSHCEIVTQHKLWADEIVLLCRSLGLQATSYGKTGVPGYEDRVYWRIQISGDLSVVPTRIKRKRFPSSDMRTDPTRVGFTIEAMNDGEFFGWELDGDGLFLLADCTVTHNSSILVMIADENIKLGKKVMIVSAEDSEKIYGDRLLLRRAQVHADNLRHKKLTDRDWTAITEEVKRAEDVPVYLDARGKPVEWVCRNVKRLIKEHGIDLVAYDYLQAFDNEKHQQDRRNQVTYISRVLTDSVKSADVAGIIFSQITVQEGKSHPDKHSIRESRDVSNAAEVVMLGFTPEKPVTRGGVTLAPPGGKCILVDKCKDGPRGGVIQMPWNDDVACFITVPDPEVQRFQQIVGDKFDDFGDPN